MLDDAKKVVFYKICPSRRCWRSRRILSADPRPKCLMPLVAKGICGNNQIKDVHNAITINISGVA